jgi:hypothetical protein
MAAAVTERPETSGGWQAANFGETELRSGAEDPATLVPSALSEAQGRARSSRLRAARSLARARSRRRVVPPLVVGAAALLGGGLSATWVDGTLPTSAAGGTARPVSTAAPNAELKALRQVHEALAADKMLVSSLSKAARKALATSAKTTVVNEVSSGSTTGGTLPSSVSGGAGSGSLGSLPSLPSLPPMPSINVPTTQGTTGASHAVP